MARSSGVAKMERGAFSNRTTSPHSLTPRQKEILRLVAQGMTNREIAGNLDISVRTVEVHRFNLHAAVARAQCRPASQASAAAASPT